MALKNDRLVQQNHLLQSVLEVSNILKQRRPDLCTSILPILTDAQILLSKEHLSNDDLVWLDKAMGYLCYFKSDETSSQSALRQYEKKDLLNSGGRL